MRLGAWMGESRDVRANQPGSGSGQPTRVWERRVWERWERGERERREGQPTRVWERGAWSGGAENHVVFSGVQGYVAECPTFFAAHCFVEYYLVEHRLFES